MFSTEGTKKEWFTDMHNAIDLILHTQKKIENIVVNKKNHCVVFLIFRFLATETDH